MNLLFSNFYKIACLFFVTMLVSCGNGDSASSGESTEAKRGTANTTAATAVNDPSQDPVYKKGLGLVAKSDCLTCHKIDEKLVGPSYRSVAEKYTGAPNDVIAALAQKIIKGGVGNWGNVPMLAHPTLSQDDAETMVRYILLLKK